MTRKTIAIVDSSTFHNASTETVRLESTFGAFRNIHLANYYDKIDWIIVGNKDIVSATPHKFYHFTITNEDFLQSQISEINAGIIAVTNLKKQIATKCGVTPDLIIFSSDNSKDWDEFDTVVNGLNATSQSIIRNSILMINTACCRYDIIIPQIIGSLGLDNN